MAQLVVDDTHVQITLTTFERIAALRSVARYPISSVVSVEPVEVARDRVKGIRAPGTAIPGGMLLGTWRSKGGPSFVAISGRGPGYVIKLEGENVRRLVVESPSIGDLDDLASVLSGMTAADSLQSVLDAYQAQWPAEAADLERLRPAIESGNHWSRTEPLHLTSSGFIVDRATKQVLMRWHERQQTWLQVGGHADPNETDPLVVVLREGLEESGLTDLAPWDDAATPVHIVIVPVPANEKEPAHEHADVRFILATDRPDEARAENERAEVRWVDFDEARAMTSEENVREALRRVEKTVFAFAN